MGTEHGGPTGFQNNCRSNPCYVVRPEGFEPPTYWSVANFDQDIAEEIETAIVMMRTHIARDLDYDTAEDRTILAIWRVVKGVEGATAGASLAAFDKMWALIFEMATSDLEAAREAGGDELTCSRCRAGLTFDSDGNQWCGVCEPDADEMFQAEHDYAHQGDISDPPAGTPATVGLVHRRISSTAGLTSWGTAGTVQGLDSPAADLSEIRL